MKKFILTLLIIVLSFSSITAFAGYETISLYEKRTGYDTYDGVYSKKVGYTKEVNVNLGATVTIEIDIEDSKYNVVSRKIKTDSKYISVVSSDYGSVAKRQSVTLTGLNVGSSILVYFINDYYESIGSTRKERIVSFIRVNVVDTLKLSLDKTQYTIYMGTNRTYYNRASITPYDQYKKGLTWTSSNPEVISISYNGNQGYLDNNIETLTGCSKDGQIEITPLSPGISVITCSTSDGQASATCTVTVKDPYTPVTGILLDKKTVNLLVDESITLEATIYPYGATNQNITWVSSDPKVAIISGGTIYAKAEGTTVITATTDDGGYTATCNVTVSEDVITATAVNIRGMDLIVGDITTLNPVLTPLNATTDKSAQWESSNSEIVSVSENGQIRANNIGSAKITVTTNDNNLSAHCTINVRDWGMENDTLYITGCGNMTNYTSTTQIPWYSDRLTIKKIIVNDGITSLGSKAFYGCINAESIEIPESVTYISDTAFVNCDELSIHSYLNSYAIQYAKNNNIPYVILNSPVEELKQLNVEYSSNSKKYYFDVTIEEYSDNGVVYVGLYGNDDVLLDLKSSALIDGDITSLSIDKNNSASYAKVFVWEKNSLKPITLYKKIDIVN